MLAQQKWRAPGLYIYLRRLRGFRLARCALICAKGLSGALLCPAVMMALVATVRRLAVAFLALTLLSSAQVARCTATSQDCSSFGPRVDCGRPTVQSACLLLCKNTLDTPRSVLALFLCPGAQAQADPRARAPGLSAALDLADGFMRTATVSHTGYVGIQEGECVAKGCCWLPVDRTAPLAVDQPWCFYPNTGRSEYRLSGAEDTSALLQGSAW